MAHARHPWKTSGLARLMRAARHQWDGIRHGLLADAAIRQGSVASWLLMGVAVLLPVPRLERLLLVLSVLLVVMMEYVNSAIEAVVDRISLEIHPQSKIAKDLASVAVTATAAFRCPAMPTSWRAPAGSSS